jgi:uncharacterized protein (TIGR03435 family)
MLGKIGSAFLLVCAMATAVAVAPVANAQASVAPDATPTAKPITFEVASVRLNKTGAHGGHGPTADGYDQKNLPLIIYLGMAYGLMEFQRIEGLPDWCKTDGYDIAAKVSDADIPEWRKDGMKLFPAALQALLADRFHLKMHYEMRDAPAYALVLAKGGPKFKQATPGETYPDGFHTGDGKPALGLGEKWEPGSDHGLLIGQAATMAQLAQNFSSMLNPVIGRQVVDRTGLAGPYDFSMPVFREWSGSHQGEDSEATIFTVLEDSLGLKLEPIKVPMQFLVVDHIERPTEN